MLNDLGANDPVLFAGSRVAVFIGRKRHKRCVGADPDGEHATGDLMNGRPVRLGHRGPDRYGVPEDGLGLRQQIGRNLIRFRLEPPD